MLKFLCFGSGSSGNSYYLSNGRDAIIIDAGVGIRSLKKNILKYGINPAKIKAIFITHEHLDHTRSVGILSKLLNVKVYSSQPVLDKIMLSKLSKVESGFCVPINDGETIHVGDFLITPFHIPHDSVENYGYSISYNEIVFTIMTDIGTPTDVVKKHIRLSNYLVIEADYDVERLDNNPRYEKKLKKRIAGGCGHLSNIQTATLLAENYHAGLKCVWLCHLSAENNSPELAKGTIESFFSKNNIYQDVNFNLNVLNRKSISGPWIVSSDGLNDDLTLKIDFDFS